MLILFSSPSSLFTATAATSRVSATSSLNLSSASRSWISLGSSVRNRSRCPCFFYSSKVRGMAELVQDKKASSDSSTVVASSSGDQMKDVKHSRVFLDAQSGEDLLSRMRTEMEAGRLPSNIASGMEELYQNYRKAVYKSGNPRADEVVLSNMTVAFDRIQLDVEDSFDFSPYHKAIRKPFDYYMFGQNLIRPLVDFRNSYVGNISLFQEIEEKLQQGHNIVLMSNHQTEADPAIIALLLETTNPIIAENLTYVAGDRVLTDPLCKPFSMGRNLICVYSKKHLYDVPELAEMKKRSNTRSLKEMALLLRGGSQIIWIAPSGGRDRPDPLTGQWYPAPFDTSAVDNMRRLAEHSDVPSHIYPLALLCHNIMPPPPQVEKDIGEKRVISFHGAGVSVAPEISFLEIAAACENPEEVKKAYAQALFDSVTNQYDVLKSAIHDKQLEASSPSVSLSQPWN